jgi:hypothetical protein
MQREYEAIMNKRKRGRHPLPEGWERIYFNASPEHRAYFRRVQTARNLATRSDVLRLIADEAMQASRFLNGNDAIIAEVQP